MQSRLDESIGYMKEDAFNDQGIQEGTGANEPAAGNQSPGEKYSYTLEER